MSGLLFDPDIAACAQLVDRADPDRFAATLATPVAVRGILFPLYAFNVEVARAPWVTTEPMIAEMRLQWWADALEEIATGAAVRRHEVVTPLAAVLDVDAARDLAALVEARRWDIYTDPFEDQAQFTEYLAATTGRLLWVAARLLGAPATDQEGVAQVSGAIALANWFRAIPELEARGRMPLPDGRPETVAALAGEALRALSGQNRLGKPARQVLLSGWRARHALRQAQRDPMSVAEGRLQESEFRRRLTLLKSTLTGRI